MDKPIEIEMRAMFDKTKHDQLKKFLDKNAEDLGQDDKDVYFYILPDKLLKVTENVSKKNAKLTLKLNRIGNGSSFEEIEFPINQKDVGKAVKMFDSLQLTDNFMRSFQKRHNYLYKGVELALKYSDVWGYHLELEVMVHAESEKKEAEKKISQVAEALGVKLLSEKELKKFVDKVESEKKKEREANKNTH